MRAGGAGEGVMQNASMSFLGDVSILGWHFQGTLGFDHLTALGADSSPLTGQLASGGE